MKKTTVFMTGATGIMGYASLKELSRRLDRFNIRLLARKSKKNEQKLKPFIGMDGIEVVWGDLLDRESIAAAMGNADIVLHIGGMVSPLADHHPRRTMQVNVGSMRNIIDVIRSQGREDKVKVVYIGSVAQTSCHDGKYIWGRTGDPILAAPFDYYGISKILAERVLAESGIKRWVSLRQSGILHPGLLFKANDPITFHVPLKGVLEWATLEDSARLMAGVCEESVPDSFWNNFYNIGSGKEFRMTNYDFERRILKALRCPAPEKVFDAEWFATRNFHGEWYLDSDRLQEIVPFRENITVDAYFKRMTDTLPWYFRLAPLAPAFAIKLFMKHVANTPGLGTLYWKSHPECDGRLKAFFKSREDMERIPSWKDFDPNDFDREPHTLSHGYDETKPESELDLADMREAAQFRGGKCLSETMTKGDLTTPLEWECAFGHRFKASPRLVLKGGHWCPDCMPAPWRYDEEARSNPFLAQIWHESHTPDENEVYDPNSDIPSPL